MLEWDMVNNRCLQEYGLIGIFIWNVTANPSIIQCDRARKTMDKLVCKEIELKVYVQMLHVKLNVQH
jgi:uncharacterized protein